MQTKIERDFAEAQAAAANPTPVSAISGDDPTKIIVMGADGRPIDWESRKGFGSMEQKLAYASRPGFARYWFNDEPDRLVVAQKAGWTQVLDVEGKPVSRVVDKGTGMRGYLHEIPEAWYKADLQVSQKRADEIEKSIRDGNAPSPDGKTSGISGKNYYGGINMSRKSTG